MKPEWDGTCREWIRKAPTFTHDPEAPQTYTAYLSWRGERQALPRGSTPLKAFGGRTICGQEWTAEEADAYAKIYDIGDYACIFEFTREE